MFIEKMLPFRTNFIFIIMYTGVSRYVKVQLEIIHRWNEVRSAALKVTFPRTKPQMRFRNRVTAKL